MPNATGDALQPGVRIGCAAWVSLQRFALRKPRSASCSHEASWRRNGFILKLQVSNCDARASISVPSTEKCALLKSRLNARDSPVSRIIHYFADQPQRRLGVNPAFYLNIAEKLSIRTILSAHLESPSRFYIAKTESQSHKYKL